MCKQFMSCGCRQILEDLFNTAPASLSDANLACSGKRKDFGINVKFAFAYKKLCFPCSLLSYSDLGGVHVRTGTQNNGKCAPKSAERTTVNRSVRLLQG